MSNIQEKLKKGKNLSFEDSKTLFSELMEGKHNESEIIEILDLGPFYEPWILDILDLKPFAGSWMLEILDLKPFLA